MATFLDSPSQQRHYFRKNIAYTEDHIVVKKLFLYNVAVELIAEDLLNYFKGFGDVVNLKLFSSKSQRKLKNGFVFFENSLDAAKALRHTRHIVKGHNLSVQANDSWHQPDAFGFRTELVEQTALIMNLNDHCLEHILRQLSFVDRIRFARACKRFRSVYLQTSPALNRSISLDSFDGMTTWDLRDFFQLSGKHLKHLEGVITPSRCQRFCEYFGINSINVKTLRISASKLTNRNVRRMFAGLNRLQELKLRGCSLSNAGLLSLSHLTNLKRLDLSDNHLLTGHNMNCLPVSIEALILTNCNGLQSKYLSRICRSLTNLKELHMRAIYTITTGFQQVITTKGGLKIEELTISTYPDNLYEHAAKLPSLKKLIIYGVEQGTPLRTQFLPWLVEHRSQQLQHFESHGQNSIIPEMISDICKLQALHTLILPHNSLIGEQQLEALKLPQLEHINLNYWSQLSNEAVLRLILNCPKLHVLHLEECPLLTEKLLQDIIFKLRVKIRLKEDQRRLPIQIHVYGSKIKELSLQRANVAAKDIIDASLVPPATSDLYLVQTPSFLDFDLFPDNLYDGYDSEDEIDPDFDRYMYNNGFLSDDDNDDEEHLLMSYPSVNMGSNPWNQQMPFL